MSEIAGRKDEGAVDEGAAPAGGEVTRREMHHRRIDLRGWGRSDGLYEVEGRVTDRKPHDFKSPSGTKVVPAGEPMHDMGAKLVFDAGMLVHEVTAFTSAAPHEDCFDAGPTLQALKGLRMAAGWGSEVRKRLGGAQSCTHLMELLGPMATVAFQTLTMLRAGRPDVLNAEGKPVKIDSCFAYASHRGVVERRWPAFHSGPKRAPEGR